MNKEQTANFVNNLKLKTYLLAERVIDQKAKGKVTPWPFWAQVYRSATLTGVALGGLASIISVTTPLRDTLGKIITNNTDVCAQPQLYTDMPKIGLSNPFEVQVALAASVSGGGGFREKLNMAHRYGGGTNIGFYTETDMDIGVDPDDFRLALGRSLGVDKV